jgi:hypothetical protein
MGCDYSILERARPLRAQVISARCRDVHFSMRNAECLGLRFVRRHQPHVPGGTGRLPHVPLPVPCVMASGHRHL